MLKSCVLITYKGGMKNGIGSTSTLVKTRHRSTSTPASTLDHLRPLFVNLTVVRKYIKHDMVIGIIDDLDNSSTITD